MSFPKQFYALMFSNHLLANYLDFAPQVAVSHIHHTIVLGAKCCKRTVIFLCKKNTFAKFRQKYPFSALCIHFDTEITMWSFRNIGYTSTNFQLQASPVLSQCFQFRVKAPPPTQSYPWHLPLPPQPPPISNPSPQPVFYLHSSAPPPPQPSNSSPGLLHQLCPLSPSKLFSTQQPEGSFQNRSHHIHLLKSPA